MQFVYDKQNPLPAHVQIQEQIKLALLLGALRPGDTLPSIRDVENEIGIGRNVVRKAYLGLRAVGVLRLLPGKRVIVEKDLSCGDWRDISRKCEDLSRNLLPRLRKMGVSPISFARYFYQIARKAETQQPFVVFVDGSQRMATERASVISAAWHAVVPGLTIEDVEEMTPIDLKTISRVLTTHLRFNQVQKIIKNKSIEVIPLGLAFDPFTVKEWSAFPKRARIAYLIDDKDYPSVSLMLQFYHKLLPQPSISIDTLAFSEISDVPKFVRSPKYQKIILSNRVWDSFPPDLKKNPKVTYARMTIDLRSLENARIRTGVIV